MIRFDENWFENILVICLRFLNNKTSPNAFENESSFLTVVVVVVVILWFALLILLFLAINFDFIVLLNNQMKCQMKTEKKPRHTAVEYLLDPMEPINYSLGMLESVRFDNVYYV